MYREMKEKIIEWSKKISRDKRGFDSKIRKGRKMTDGRKEKERKKQKKERTGRRKGTEVLKMPIG